MNRRLRNKDSVSLRDDDVTKNFGDSIKLIRSRIQKSAEEHGDKVILFASSVPGEGKTTVALNTAVALAQEGKCTVLIDCDVRKPATIGDFRGLKPAGLVEYLNGTAELADIISQPVDNLFVINGNTTADNAAELFRTDKMAELINALREVAELIIWIPRPAPSLRMHRCLRDIPIVRCMLFAVNTRAKAALSTASATFRTRASGSSATF